MLNYVAFIVYFPITIFALYKMKAAHAVISWDFVFGFAMYGLGAFVWLYALRKFPLSFAFPFAAGLLIVGTQFSGYFFLKESIDIKHMIAVSCIIIGLILLIPRHG